MLSHSCPRCDGDLYLETDMMSRESVWHCLQCGYEHPLNLSLDRVREAVAVSSVGLRKDGRLNQNFGARLPVGKF